MGELAQKLTSRKLWIAAAGFAAGCVVVALGDVEYGVKLMGGSLAVYIGGEAATDVARLVANKIVTTNSTTVSASTTSKDVVQDAMKKDAE